MRLAPAAVIGVVVRNLIVAHQPVDALGEWDAPYQPGLLGLGPGEAAALNDDRVGRMLDRLFDADRATLITEVVLRSIREFDVEASQLHNDSTATPVITYSTEVATAHRYRGVRRHDRPTDGAEEPQFPWQRR